MSILSDKIKANQEAAQTVDKGNSPETVKKSNGAEYQRKQKQQRYDDAVAIKDFLEKKGLLKEIEKDASLNAALNRLTKQPGTGAAFGGNQEPLVYRLFGNAPKVGQRISMLAVFQKTRKGYNEFKQQVNKWKTKGVLVLHYDENTNPNEPAWVIDSIGTLPAWNAGADA